MIPPQIAWPYVLAAWGLAATALGLYAGSIFWRLRRARARPPAERS